MHSKARTTFATFFEGLLIRRAHPLSASYELILFWGARPESLLGSVQGVSWGAYRESPLYFLSLPLYVAGTSLTTSLRYQDAVLAASYIYA
jgi:hypothetical protein